MGNDDVILFDYDKATEVLGEIRSSYSEKIKTSLSDLHDISKVIPESWDSKAASSFKDSYNSLIANTLDDLDNDFNNFLTTFNSTIEIKKKNEELLRKYNDGDRSPEASLVHSYGVDNVTISHDGNGNSLVIVTVKEGDSIYSKTVDINKRIFEETGKESNLTWKDVAIYNNISEPYVIQPGDKLRFPISSNSSTESGDN